MNEIISKQNLFTKVKNFLKLNIKLILIFIIFIVVIFAILQLYFFIENKKILNSSIKFEKVYSNYSNIDSFEILDELSLENNMYGVLATLEKIKIYIKNNDLYLANEEYLKLMDHSQLNKNYKSLIAIQGSFTFIDKISHSNKNEVLPYINSLIEFIDPKIDSYKGYLLEISYLLNLINFNLSEAEIIYEKILINDEIPDSLKNRVKKIHAFNKINK